MTRAIKFRGKHIDTGQWIIGESLLRAGDDVHIFPTPSPDSVDRYRVKPATVGQFTGLTDKDGKEIYEGDIVKFRTRRFRGPKWNQPGRKATWKWFISVVMFHDASFFINESGKLEHPCDVENFDTFLCTFAMETPEDYEAQDKYDNNPKLGIIGNIHDHPEVFHER